MLQHEWTLKDIMLKWNKPVTKGQILYGSTYVRYLELSNSQTESRMVAASG